MVVEFQKYLICPASRHLSRPARLPLCLSPIVGVIEVLSSNLYGFLSLVEIADSLEDDDSLDDNLGVSRGES